MLGRMGATVAPRADGSEDRGEGMPGAGSGAGAKRGSGSRRVTAACGYPQVFASVAFMLRFILSSLSYNNVVQMPLPKPCIRLVPVSQGEPQ